MNTVLDTVYLTAQSTTVLRECCQYGAQWPGQEFSCGEVHEFLGTGVLQ